MSQYCDGKIIISDTDRSIVNGVDTLFLSNVSQGCLLIFDIGEPIVHTVKEVISDTKLRLSSKCIDVIADIMVGYSITKNFSYLLDIPLCSSNYKSFAQLSTLSLRMIDVVFKNLEFINSKDPKCSSLN